MSYVKDHAYSHDENRRKICLFCLRKKGRNGTNVMINITKDGKIEALVNDIFKYDADDQGLPNAVCRTCLNKLYASNKNKKKLLEPPKVSFNYKYMCTRQSDEGLPCNCLICQLARARPGVSVDNKIPALRTVPKVIKNKFKGLYRY